MSIVKGGGPRDDRFCTYSSERTLLALHDVSWWPPRPMRPGDMLVERRAIAVSDDRATRQCRCGLVIGIVSDAAVHVMWSDWK